MSDNIGNVDYKELIREEFKRCSIDPIHFLTKYCLIQHPQKGKIKFNLYEFQKRTLLDFKEHPYNVILKARQLGISTLTAGYSLWLMTFHDDKNILVIATKQEVAKNLIIKIRVMYNNLPKWLKIPYEEDNKLSLRLKNGSQAKAISTSAEAGRSEALSLLVLDEAAFLPHADEIWTSAQQTLATGGGCIVLSTPNGLGNWFHRIWAGAEEGTNDFNWIKLHWSIHPERDQTWRNKQDRILGERKARQECDTDFLSSGNSVIDPRALKYLENITVKEPIEKRYNKRMWIWKYPESNADYLIAADVARGDGGDYSAFHVLNSETMEQVAEFKGKIATDDFGNMLVNVANEYNQALLVIENASIGWAVLQVAIDRDYPNLYYTNKDFKYIDVKTHLKKSLDITDKSKVVAGFTTSRRTRPLIIEKLERICNDKTDPIQIRSKRLISELYVFIWTNRGKAEAQQGYNDDLVMSYAIALWVRDTAIKLRNEGIKLTKKMIATTGKVTFAGGKSQYKENYGWTQTTKGGEEFNLRELLS